MIGFSTKGFVYVDGVETQDTFRKPRSNKPFHLRFNRKEKVLQLWDDDGLITEKYLGNLKDEPDLCPFITAAGDSFKAQVSLR